MKFINFIKLFASLLILTGSSSAYAQLSDGFDIKKVYQNLINKGYEGKRLDEYVEHEHTLYLNEKKAVQNHNHSHNKEITDLGVIYKNPNNTDAYRPSNPNSPQNTYCPNAGFEQFSFTNWQGATGSVSTGTSGAPFPVYTQTATSIVNPAGNNTSQVNTSNFHTILTTPATNSVYPNCVGYDSIAVRVIGTQTVSEIPLVNPNGGPASVRMNQINSNNSIASKLTYNMALNPNNKNFTISYALVLCGSSFHQNSEQPYFSVIVKDQNGNTVPGCSQYAVTVNSLVVIPGSTNYDPLFKQSSLTYGSDPIYYRPWATYAFDFSNYPAITSVSVEFYVGGCSGGAHFGYAYVDADCSTGGALTSFCAGSGQAVLTGPNGFSTYQWVGPSGAISNANGGNTATATVSPVSAGQVYTCTATAPGGCTTVFQTTVSVTTVSITGLNSTPSCLGGNSGTTNVTATGSSSGYTYQWYNSSGTPVGSAQTATGLSPGIYSITVNSPMCGSATSTVAVNVSPPSYYGLSAPFCGSVAWITNSGGSGYKWYTASPLALIAGATSSSLTINSPVNGTQYYLTYTTASGCKDSIKYTLAQTAGGSIYVSNIKSICPGNSNSYAVVNLQTTAPPVYSYSVTGPSGYSSTLTNTTSVKDSVVGLSIGTYTVIAFDGQCLYNTTFTVAPFAYSYTLTPQNGTVCTSGATTLTANFGNTTPTTCGLSNSGCTSPNIIVVGNGTTGNSTTSSPAPYGNFDKNRREQYLFTAAELSAAGLVSGNISSISFLVNSLQPLNTTSTSSSSTYIGTLPNYSIKMKCTTATALSDFDNTGLTQVYFGNFTPVIGVNTHILPQAYSWDGASSILVDVCYTRNSPLTNEYWTSNPVTPYTNIGIARTVYYSADATPACGNLTGTTSTNRPNIKFGNCGGQNPSAFTYTWAPNVGLSSTTTYSTIANPSVTTIYSVQVNPIGQTNCMQAQTATLVVIQPTTPTITPVSTLCSNASSFSLTALPTGGTWSLTASTNTLGIFTPSLASVGNNTVSYTYGPSGCSQTTTAIIPIEKYVPSTITGTINPLCITNSTINLATALTTSTLGTGVWSGNGVSGTTFNPLTAGTGTTILTYSTNSSPTPSLCPSTSTIAISISSITQPTISPAGPYCDNFAIQTMTVAPVVIGGTWTSTTSPTAISTSGQFNPTLATLGNSSIIYSVTNGPCTASTSINVNVIHYIPATITGTMGPYCIYNPTVNLQAAAQYTGGVWSGVGVTGSDFSPTLSGAGTHSVVYSTDPAPSGLCPDSKTLTILVNAKPQANALSDVLKGCNPLQANLYTGTVNTGNATWDFGDGSPLGSGLSTSHIYTVAGIYTAIISYTDAIGCTNDSAVVNSFTVFPNPIASFEPSAIEATVVDAQIDFTNQSTVLNNNTYLWDIAGLTSSTQINTSYLFTNSGKYIITLTATSPDNCIDDTSIVVIVKPDVVLYVPNAFTPGNGDGLNDLFQIYLPPTGVDYSTFSLQIFNRWGEMVYSTIDVTASWNGAKNNTGPLLPQGVYTWKISFKDELKKIYEKVGHVMLLSK